MGGRTGITYQEVEQAIVKLKKQGKNLTVENIRQVLGTGSNSTIAKFLREWRKNHGFGENDAGNLPSELVLVVRKLWDKLQEHAQSQRIAYQKEMDEELSTLQQKLQQSIQQHAKSQTICHELEEKLNQEMNNNQSLQCALINTKQENVKLTERCNALADKHQESQLDNQRLHDLLKQVQANLEHYQQSVQSLRSEQSLIIEKERHQAEQKLLHYETQLKQIMQEKSDCQAKATQLETSNQELEKALYNIRQVNESAQQAMQQLSLEKANVMVEKKQLIEHSKQQSQNMTNQERIIINFEVTLKENNKKIANLESTLSKAEDKIEKLRQDCQFESQEKANLLGQVKQLQSILSHRDVEIA